MPGYNKLVAKLRDLCDNKSEIDGSNPDWQYDFMVEPHHILGRTGDLLTDPFNIIMLTRTQHDIEEGKIIGKKLGKDYLLKLVAARRIEQGFRPLEEVRE